MEPITMKFLHVIEQNDIYNYTELLKKWILQTGSSVITKIVVYYFFVKIIITIYSFWIINLFYSSTIVAKWLNYFRNIDNFWCNMQFSVLNKIFSSEETVILKSSWYSICDHFSETF